MLDRRRRVVLWNFEDGPDWGKGSEAAKDKHSEAPMKKLGWRPFIYGGIASCCAELGTFPIDTSKTRLQIQGQTIDPQFQKQKYTGMTNALITITKEEGFKSLYHGIMPALLRQSTYGTLKFGIYYSLKSVIMKRRGRGEEVSVNILCGIVAGVVSSCIANPTDVLKVRMQIAGRSGHHEKLFRSLLNIYRNEGIHGLWRGVGPTAQRAAVIAAVELPIYDFSKLCLLDALGDTITNHFISSFIASFGATVATTPIDVCRTRIMNQIVQRDATNLYRSSFDCFFKTWRNEGPLALYRGFVPTWLRLGPWNVIFFVTYEQLRKF